MARVTSSKNRPTKPDTHPKEFKSTQNIAAWIVKQLCVAAGVLVVIYLVYENSRIYRWVHTGLLMGNYELIQKYPQATYQQRLEMKLGAMVPYLNFIKEKTPETAIILVPPPGDECFNKTQQEFDLKQLNNNTLSSYGYARFLWPRRCISENRRGETPLFDQITHVAIVNGWGFQHLNYEVEKPFYVGVYPKNK